jgi:hypothetical protein
MKCTRLPVNTPGLARRIQKDLQQRGYKKENRPAA